jgi:hypothetical protein
MPALAAVSPNLESGPCNPHLSTSSVFGGQCVIVRERTRGRDGQKHSQWWRMKAHAWTAVLGNPSPW